MSVTIKAAFQWNGDGDLLRAKNLETGGRVQTAIDNAVISYCMPYCPWETGTLARSPFAASPPGGGQVIYATPYARYLYYGEPKYSVKGAPDIRTDYRWQLCFRL